LSGLKTVFAWHCQAFLDQRLTFFAHFVANQRTGCCPAYRAKRAANDGIACYAAQHRASGGANLCIGRAGAAAAQGYYGSSSDGQ